MVLLQQMTKKPATIVTVKDLSECFNNGLVSLTRDYDEIILVFDTYRDYSLKSATRDKRRQGRAPIQYQVRDDTNIKPEQDVWAPPFGRRRLGAGVWAPPFGRTAVWAPDVWAPALMR